MIILESTNTPKYVVGFGPTDIPAVVWMDVLNIKEAPTAISFVEDGETYRYGFSTEDNEYVELNNKAPGFTRYEILSEEELFKRGYLKSFRAENTLDFLDALGDILGDDYDDEYYDEDDEDDYYSSRSHHSSCGWHRPTCGYYGSCGGYGGGC
jgi:hypothetical protein